MLTPINKHIVSKKLPSEEGTPANVQRTLTLKPRPVPNIPKPALQ